MERKIQVKKRRSDRNHLIYLLTSPTQEVYVGITVISGRAVKKSLDERWKRHVHRALHEQRTWKLCEAIRNHGAESFKREPIRVVRGKALAHREERQLIQQYSASLNTF